MRARDFPARFWRCDVSSEAEVSRVFSEVATHFGRIDVVVNNAGVAGVNKPTHELTEAEWDWVQSINVKGVFFAPSTLFRCSEVGVRKHHQSFLDLRAGQCPMSLLTMPRKERSG